jgi:hypothetical protein
MNLKKSILPAFIVAAAFTGGYLSKSTSLEDNTTVKEMSTVGYAALGALQKKLDSAIKADNGVFDKEKFSRSLEGFAAKFNSERVSVSPQTKVFSIHDTPNVQPEIVVFGDRGPRDDTPHWSRRSY